MKVVLCLTLIGLFGFIGYSISLNYIKRKKFYCELSIFCNSLKSEIGYSQTRLEELITKHLKDLKNAELSSMLENYLLAIKNNDLSFKIFTNIGILTEREKETLLSFFKSLGRLDANNQLQNIEKFLNFIEVDYASACEESKRLGGLYTKIGVIIGAVLALILC